MNDDSSHSGVAFGKRMRKALRKAAAVGAVFLAFVAACSRGDAAHTALRDSGTTQAPAAALTPDFATFSKLPDAATASDFATVSKLINDAIAADTLPGPGRQLNAEVLLSSMDCPWP